MTNTEKNIVWEKWKDPYDDRDEWFPRIDNKKIEKEEEEEEFSEEDIVFEQLPQILMTNMGMVPLDRPPSIGKIFNFWTGHTSFSISGPIAARIESVEGVEILDIYTRYRFRVGIGKLFKDREVMNAIQQAIYINE